MRASDKIFHFLNIKSLVNLQQSYSLDLKVEVSQISPVHRIQQCIEIEEGEKDCLDLSLMRSSTAIKGITRDFNLMR